MRATRTLLSTCAIAAIAIAAAPNAQAQSAQRFSIQASGLFVGTSGDAYDGMNAGPGVELQLRYTPSVWSFGLGYQYSSHSLEENALTDNSVSLMGVFFEPRRTFDIGSSSYAPYASGRLALLRESLDIEDGGISLTAKASGVQLNVGGGVLFRVSPRVNLDLGATVGLINFGDLEISSPGLGSAVIGDGGSGSNLVFRVGAAIGL